MQKIFFVIPVLLILMTIAIPSAFGPGYAGRYSMELMPGDVEEDTIKILTDYGIAEQGIDIPVRMIGEGSEWITISDKISTAGVTLPDDITKSVRVELPYTVTVPNDVEFAGDYRVFIVTSHMKPSPGSPISINHEVPIPINIKVIAPDRPVKEPPASYADVVNAKLGNTDRGTPTPPPVTLSVSTDTFEYYANDLVTINVLTSASANVAITVTGSAGDNMLSRVISTDSVGRGSLQFKLPDSSQVGYYRVDASATIYRQTVTDAARFVVNSATTELSVISLQPTDQQGNVVSSFTKGKLGFAKVVLYSNSPVNALVTINLFDSELVTLGIGSFKTTFGSEQSETILSFFIPDYAQSGNAHIYANVFSDWPSQGGMPLTSETSTQVRLP